MRLTSSDIATIALFFAINLGIGLYYARRGGKSLSEFFLSGRSVPWWLAGTSMVATTFAADTPLVVTKLVADNGIAGNWLWWSMAGSGILTVFFFAALWRRSGVLTDVEFIELRYSGPPAAALRGVRAVYQGLIVNTIIMGWVNLAIAKILLVVLGIPKWEAIAICLVLTSLYVSIGGLWSVLVSDVLQFVVKMTMIVALAIAAVAAVGGVSALRSGIATYDAVHRIAGGGSHLDFFPTSNAAYMPLLTFLVYVSVAWWASSYPGSEPGGGGYIAQRIFASKDEKNSILATLFFNVAHYALRPWPWILVALASLLLYPQGVVNPTTGKTDFELNYVRTMVDYLPGSLRGLMLAGFLSAYMSTIGTQLNLGASYLTNDLYRRFIRPDASEAHYVAASRVATLFAMVVALIATNFMDSITDAWKYLITFTAGVVLVAHQRLDGDFGTACVGSHGDCVAIRSHRSARRSQCRRRQLARYGRGDDRGVVDRHLRDLAGTGRNPDAFLQSRPPQRARLAAYRGVEPSRRRTPADRFGDRLGSGMRPRVFQSICDRPTGFGTVRLRHRLGRGGAGLPRLHPLGSATPGLGDAGARRC